MNKKLALFDIDGTTLPLGVAGFSDLVRYLASIDLITKEIAERMNQVHENYTIHKDISYEDHAALEFKIFAEGLEGESYDETYLKTADFMDKNIKKNIYPSMEKLIKDLESLYDIFFITANVQFYAQFFSNLFKAKGFEATMFDVKEGKFTGKISRSLARAEEKQIAIGELLSKYPKKGSLAFGDAEGDRFMLSSVETPICINPTHGFLDEALKNKWIITDPENVEEVIKKLGII